MPREPSVSKRKNPMIPSIQESALQQDATSGRLLIAMMKCEGWAPTCADLGSCQQNGRCFSQAASHYANCQGGEVWVSVNALTAAAA